MHLVKRALAASFSCILSAAALALFLTATAGTALAHTLHGNPEIDPGSIGSAITLFVAGALYLTSRRHAK
jgi:hypothetical protein